MVATQDLVLKFKCAIKYQRKSKTIQETKLNSRNSMFRGRNDQKIKPYSNVVVADCLSTKICQKFATVDKGLT